MNNKLILEFTKLIKQVQFELENSKDRKEATQNSFRLKQLRNVLQILKKFPDEITSVDQLKDIKGVGKGTIRRIDEILEKGKLKEIYLNKGEQKYLDKSSKLQEIIGIGSKKAHELIVKHNIKSVEQLKKMHKEGKITLPETVLTGLKYYGKVKTNIPREEMMKLEDLIKTTIKKVDLELHGIIAGSYRRLKPKSNDIDLLLTHPQIKTKKDLEDNDYLVKLVKSLQKNKIVLKDSLTHKNPHTKFMGFIKLNSKAVVRRIDIRFIPTESYYPALLYFTGSGEFNRYMRGIAVDLGYMLNEYGLFKGKRRIKVNSEKDIFEKLGMEYLSPEDRERF